MKARDILHTCSIDDLPDLDVAVRGALELFQEVSLPTIDIARYQQPLVVGSGGSEATGRIVFEQTHALFASESTVEHMLARVPAIDRVVLISASGTKHAPDIVRVAHAHNKPITLITNSPQSPARSMLHESAGDEVLVFPKNTEPYTYNTSTYLGMVLAQTGESPAEIEHFIDTHIDTLDVSMLGNYDGFYITVPARFGGIIRLFSLKFIELFGRRIARDIETDEYSRKHATTVVPHDKELFITFGQDTGLPVESGQHLVVPLPANAQYGALMAIGYYVIGKIQGAHPAYFKEHIHAYIARTGHGDVLVRTP